MIRTIGRILLLAAAGLLIYSGVKNFMTDYNLIKEFDGGLLGVLKNFISDENARNLFLNFFKDCFWFLVACTALLGAIFGHGGFWMTIFSIVSLGLIGYSIYTKLKAGDFSKDMKGTILLLVFDFGAQIAYVLGVIFVKIGNSIKESVEE